MAMPSEQDLMALTHRGAVAYASRCARRVWRRFPLWLLGSAPEVSHEQHAHIDALRMALEYADGFASGLSRPVSDYKSAEMRAAAAGQYAARHAENHWPARAAAQAADAVIFAVKAAGVAEELLRPDSAIPPDAPARLAFSAASISRQVEGRAERPAEEDFKKLLALCRNDGGVIEAGGGVNPNHQLGRLYPLGSPDWYAMFFTAKDRE